MYSQCIGCEIEVMNILIKHFYEMLLWYIKLHILGAQHGLDLFKVQTLKNIFNISNDKSLYIRLDESLPYVH